MKKKLLSVCLALALAFSLLPAAAFAAEEPTTGETTTQDPTGTEGTTPTTPGGGDSTQGTPTSPQDPNEDESDLPQGPSESSVAECNGQYYDRLMDAIPGSGKVTLLQDVSGESIQIPSGSSVTIDLAGHDLVCTGMDLLTISGDLTIQDSTGDDPKVSGMIRVLAGASLNISAGSYSGGLDVAIASGTCKISGGRFPDNYLLENYLASGYVRIQDGRETSSYPLTVVRASTSGTLITGVKWSVSGGTLTFSGKGAIPDYGSHLYTPWIWLGDRITNVVLQDGITKIGVRSLAFLGDWFGGTSLTIPASVTAISDLSLAFSTLSTIDRKSVV